MSELQRRFGAAAHRRHRVLLLAFGAGAPVMDWTWRHNDLANVAVVGKDLGH
jgi:hypothetical protein